MTRPAHLLGSVSVAASGAALAALAALGPWPTALALDGRDTIRTVAVAALLLTTFAALYSLAATRLRSLARPLRPARLALAISTAFPLALLAYKAAYPALPYEALWVVAALVGTLGLVAAAVWIVTVATVALA